MTTTRPGLVDGAVAVVTGVGPGLGRATALALAREGAAVVLVARSADRLDGVAAEITAAGGRALAAPASVTKPEECGSAWPPPRSTSSARSTSW